jgi:hypothetical protein
MGMMIIVIVIVIVIILILILIVILVVILVVILIILAVIVLPSLFGRALGCWARPPRTVLRFALGKRLNWDNDVDAG